MSLHRLNQSGHTSSLQARCSEAVSALPHSGRYAGDHPLEGGRPRPPGLGGRRCSTQALFRIAAAAFLVAFGSEVSPSQAQDSIADTQNPETAPAPEPPELPFELPMRTPDADVSSTSHAPGGMAAQPGSTPPVAAMPQSTLSAVRAEGEDIRDIRGPVHIAPSHTWVWLGLAALAALAAPAWLWYRYRNRDLARALKAYEIAFKRLEEARGLMRPEEARAFSFLVSETVRTYLDDRFRVGACHCTTEEFLRELAGDPAGPLQPHADALRTFLGHCDLAKFAKWGLATDQMQAMHAGAWRLVDETRPRTEEASRRGKRARKKKDVVMVENVTALATGGAQ